MNLSREEHKLLREMLEREELRRDGGVSDRVIEAVFMGAAILALIPATLFGLHFWCGLGNESPAAGAIESLDRVFGDQDTEEVDQ